MVISMIIYDILCGYDITQYHIYTIHVIMCHVMTDVQGCVK